MTRIAIIALTLLTGSNFAEAQQSDPRVADLVQAGKIRVALFLPQYVKDSATGEIRGLGTGFISMKVWGELATRLGIKMQVVENPTPPKAVECIQAGACDVLFTGIEASRVKEVDFTPPVMQFDYAFLVPAGSSIRTVADADQPGIRIAIVRSHASALALSRLVKHAELVGAELPDSSFALLRDGKADVLAFPREVLIDYSTKLPGSRVLDEPYGINLVGVAIAKGQPERLAYLSEFLEEAKASGLIQRLIEQGGLRGFQVSPRGSVSAR
jgi:polar amino acid transport system substrate-binding protein